jgi:hypothetical protein
MCRIVNETERIYEIQAFQLRNDVPIGRLAKFEPTEILQRIPIIVPIV